MGKIKITAAMMAAYTAREQAIGREREAKENSRAAFSEAMRWEVTATQNALSDFAYKDAHNKRVEATENAHNKRAEFIATWSPITRAAAEVQTRAKERTLETWNAAELAAALNTVAANVGKKKLLEGVTVVYRYGAGKFASGYKYDANGTTVKATFRRGEWIIEQIARENVKNEPKMTVTYTDEAKNAMLARLADGAAIN